MTWVVDILGVSRVVRAKEQAARRRLVAALDVEALDLGNVDELREVGSALELSVFDSLAEEQVEVARFRGQ